MRPRGDIDIRVPRLPAAGFGAIRGCNRGTATRLYAVRAPGVRCRALVAACLLGLAHIAWSDPELDTRFAKDVIIIVANRHACHRFDVWLALDDRQRQRGLMFVRELPETSGMLFVYDEPGRHSMWMKNTFLPLDMLFIRSDGTIASIAADTEPQSLRSVAATEPVRFVLELNAGVAEDLSITTDSYMLWLPGAAYSRN